MENPSLKKVQKLLNNFFTYYKTDNVLVVADNKFDAPFAFIISSEEKERPLLISVSVDYPYVERAVEIALLCSRIKKTSLTESFYFSKTGATHLGEAAFKYHELDTQLPLEMLEPVSITKH